MSRIFGVDRTTIRRRLRIAGVERRTMSEAQRLNGSQGRLTGRPRGTPTVSRPGMAAPPETEIAWAAGLFDGEGSTVLTPWGVRLQMKMTDQDVLEHLLHVLGGVLNGPYQYNVPGKPARKPFWFWSLTGPTVPHVCRLMEPWLGRRRRDRMDQYGVFAQMQFPIFDEALLAPDSEE